MVCLYAIWNRGLGPPQATSEFIYNFDWLWAPHTTLHSSQFTLFLCFRTSEQCSGLHQQPESARGLMSLCKGKDGERSLVPILWCAINSKCGLQLNCSKQWPVHINSSLTGLLLLFVSSSSLSVCNSWACLPMKLSGLKSLFQGLNT